MTMVVAALFPSSASAAERSYSVSDFERVRVTGSMTVNIVKGRATTAKASGSQASLDRLSIAVADRELVIVPQSQQSGGFPAKSGPPPVVTITVPALSRIRVNGSARVNVASMGSATSELSLSGSGLLQIGRIDADRAVITVSGEGKVQIAGAVKSLTAIVLGSGTLDAAALKASDLATEISTSGNVIIGAVRSAKVATSGSGDITITGKPACTVRNTGSGTVTCGNRQAAD